MKNTEAKNKLCEVARTQTVDQCDEHRHTFDEDGQTMLSFTWPALTASEFSTLAGVLATTLHAVDDSSDAQIRGYCSDDYRGLAMQLVVWYDAGEVAG